MGPVGSHRTGPDLTPSGEKKLVIREKKDEEEDSVHTLQVILPLL